MKSFVLIALLISTISFSQKKGKVKDYTELKIEIVAICIAVASY